jgi:hypothetical protein
VVKYPVGPVGMTVTYGEDGVTVDMRKYIKTMIEEFSIDLGDSSASSPAADDLFLIGSSKNLDKQRAEELHTVVAKGLFACKRARPDIHTATTFLCMRVKQPNQTDWAKLLRKMQCLNGSKEEAIGG